MPVREGCAEPSRPEESGDGAGLRGRLLLPLEYGCWLPARFGWSSEPSGITRRFPEGWGEARVGLPPLPSLKKKKKKEKRKKKKRKSLVEFGGISLRSYCHVAGVLFCSQRSRRCRSLLAKALGQACLWGEAAGISSGERGRGDHRKWQVAMMGTRGGRERERAFRNSR